MAQDGRWSVGQYKSRNGRRRGCLPGPRAEVLARLRGIEAVKAGFDRAALSEHGDRVAVAHTHDLAHEVSRASWNHPGEDDQRDERQQDPNPVQHGKQTYSRAWSQLETCARPEQAPNSAIRGTRPGQPVNSRVAAKHRRFPATRLLGLRAQDTPVEISRKSAARVEVILVGHRVRSGEGDTAVTFTSYVATGVVCT